MQTGMVKTFDIIGNNFPVASINFAVSAEGDLLKETNLFSKRTVPTAAR